MCNQGRRQQRLAVVQHCLAYELYQPQPQQPLGDAVTRRNAPTAPLEGGPYDKMLSDTGTLVWVETTPSLSLALSVCVCVCVCAALDSVAWHVVSTRVRVITHASRV